MRASGCHYSYIVASYAYTCRRNKILKKDLPEQRLNSTDGWCSCGHCSVDNLRQPKECYCCREPPAQSGIAEKVRAKLDGVQCVTMHPNFSKMCLDKEVSDIVTNAAAFLRFHVRMLCRCLKLWNWRRRRNRTIWQRLISRKIGKNFVQFWSVMRRHETMYYFQCIPPCSLRQLYALDLWQTRETCS